MNRYFYLSRRIGIKTYFFYVQAHILLYYRIAIFIIVIFVLIWFLLVYSEYQVLMNQIKFSSIPLKVQEHSLTINPIYFSSCELPPTRFLQLKHYINTKYHYRFNKPYHKQFKHNTIRIQFKHIKRNTIEPDL